MEYNCHEEIDLQQLMTTMPPVTATSNPCRRTTNTSSAEMHSWFLLLRCRNKVDKSMVVWSSRDETLEGTQIGLDKICLLLEEGAMDILLVYDVINESSFSSISNWIRNIEQHASDNVTKILVGNKADRMKVKG
uniref:Uncharacterized protein n=1 Tax=Lactuca sativa TaxID=4236 RepID=A0A9R1WK54_LACSA|nr:hypothetical protein LSAT_V11C100040380 [Lactuca sativa]